jgi:hypothetical protein
MAQDIRPSWGGTDEGSKKLYESQDVTTAKAKADAYRKARRKSFAWQPPKKSGVDPDWDAFVMPGEKAPPAKSMPDRGDAGPSTTMPAERDYPDIKDFEAAMRVWRGQQRTAKDAAGALTNRPAK